MQETIEILESYGLVKDSDSLRVHEIVKRKAVRLHEELYSSIRKRQENDYFAGLDDSQQELDPFTFLASKSLRGESTCAEYGCRLEKLDALGRYAALYANQVILPLPLNHPSNVEDPLQAELELSRVSLALLHLRPLVDAGIIYPAVKRSFHCEHTIKWCEEMTSVVLAGADRMQDAMTDRYLVKYQLPEKSPTGRPSIYIEGPDAFLEHGSLVLTFDEGKGWRLKSWKFDRDGMVELRGPRKAVALDGIFRGIAEDTSLYLAYGRNRDARLLTNLPGETLLLEALTKDDEVSATSNALEDLTHSLPLLGDVPVGALVSIRHQERDSFGRYRLAVQKILSDVGQGKKRISRKEVRALFRSRIEPELTRMKSELHQEQKRQRRRMVGGIGTLAASVALGAFGGIVPAALAGAVGTGLLSKAAQSLCEHGASLKEKNDFYFLLRLTQQAED